MAFSFKNTWGILKHTFHDFGDFQVPRLSAALAYYTVFSIAPMLMVIITLLKIFYGKNAIEGKVYNEIRSFVGKDAALQIQEVIKNAAISRDITFASAIGIVALIISATVVFAEIQDSINLLWHLKAKPKKGWVKMIVNRLLSFSMVISLGFIALVSLVLNAILDALTTRLTTLFPEVTVYLIYALNLLITFAAISLLFAIIFKVLPDAKVQWKDVAVGAVTTAVLFMLGKFGIGFYLGTSKVSSTYGAAGSLIILLLWVYYSSIILYFGASFTRAYAQHTGRHIYPNEYAVFVQQVEVENTKSLQSQPDKKVKEEKT